MGEFSPVGGLLLGRLSPHVNVDSRPVTGQTMSRHNTCHTGTARYTRLGHYFTHAISLNALARYFVHELPHTSCSFIVRARRSIVLFSVPVLFFLLFSSSSSSSCPYLLLLGILALPVSWLRLQNLVLTAPAPPRPYPGPYRGPPIANTIRPSTYQACRPPNRCALRQCSLHSTAVYGQSTPTMRRRAR